MKNLKSLNLFLQKRKDPTLATHKHPIKWVVSTPIVKCHFTLKRSRKLKWKIFIFNLKFSTIYLYIRQRQHSTAQQKHLR